MKKKFIYAVFTIMIAISVNSALAANFDCFNKNLAQKWFHAKKLITT